METGKGFAVTPIVTATSTGRRWSPARARNARHASSGRTTLARGVDRTTDDEILDWVRNAAETTYHPVGTCKMGSDPAAVVDSQLRVHGITGLRIADASIMPTLTSGNTNAPSIMIGEKAADMLLNTAP
jgi:choline dehydrogenase